MESATTNRPIVCILINLSLFRSYFFRFGYDVIGFNFQIYYLARSGNGAVPAQQWVVLDSLVLSYVESRTISTEFWDSRGAASRGGESPQVKTFSLNRSRKDFLFWNTKCWGLRSVAFNGGVSPPARTEVEQS